MSQHAPSKRGGNPAPNALMAAPWSRRRLVRGLQIFTGATLVAFLVLFVSGKLGRNLTLLLSISPGILGLGVAQAVLDVVGGGVRLWLLARAFGGRIGMGPSIRANGANIFIGGVTPSQTGGGPAQIYVMVRAGLPLRVALVASLVAYLGTIVLLLGAGLMGALFGAPLAVVGEIQLVLGVASAVFAAILSVFLLAVPKPSVYRGVLRRLLGRLPRFGARLAASERLARFETLLGDFSMLVRQAGSRHKRLILGGFALTVLIYLNKFLVSYVVIRGLGISVSLLDVVYLQWVQYLVAYFAPTPGASGLAELSAATIMKPILPDAQFGAFVILWRTFTLYIPMALSGIILLRSFRPGARPARPAGAGAAMNELVRDRGTSTQAVEPGANDVGVGPGKLERGRIVQRPPRQG